MVGGRRVPLAEHAERVNAAAELLAADVPVAAAARGLAERFGVSTRQARRYAEQAAGSGRAPVPEARKASSRVRDRLGETVFVFDRHAAPDLSVAYAILVPARRARLRAGQKGRPPHDQRGDLRPGVVGPAAAGRDDRVPDGGAARARRAAGA